MKHQRIKLILGIMVMTAISFTTAFSETHFDDYCNVFIYPHDLEPADRLQDGPSGPYLRITGKTLFLWVDLEPEMDYAHPTCYILISEDGIRIEKGRWWPVLNGKRILIDEIKKYTVLSPWSLEPGPDSTLPRGFINIHIFPHELTLRDRLVDGLSGNQIRVYPNTLLVWVDLLPNAFFAHPTAYLLISKQGTRVEKGEWWPVLNGKKICHGEQNPASVISPFKVMRLLLESETELDR